MSSAEKRDREGRVNIKTVIYGRTINNGLCDAWKKIYADYKGDDGYPTDSDFKKIYEYVYT